MTDRGRPPGEAGMTLVEVLVVLAILAIAATATVLSLGSDSGMRAEAVAKRLQVTVQAASDRAMTGDDPFALALQPGGYAILRWDAAARKFAPIADESIGELQHLPDGFTVTAPDGRRVFAIDGGAIGQPFILTLTDGKRGWRLAFDGVTARLAPQAPPA